MLTDTLITGNDNQISSSNTIDNLLYIKKSISVAK